VNRRAVCATARVRVRDRSVCRPSWVAKALVARSTLPWSTCLRLRTKASCELPTASWRTRPPQRRHEAEVLSVRAAHLAGKAASSAEGPVDPTNLKVLGAPKRITGCRMHVGVHITAMPPPAPRRRRSAARAEALEAGAGCADCRLRAASKWRSALSCRKPIPAPRSSRPVAQAPAPQPRR
jgi:hypothetical protein